jgi:hypothetical protein
VTKVDDNLLADYRNKLTAPAFRSVAKVWLASISNKATSIYLMDENFATYQFALMFDRREESTDVLIRKIDQLISGGLVQKWEKERAANFDSNQLEQEPETKPVTMDHVGVCFIFIFSILGLCCVVFTIECLVGAKQDKTARKIHQQRRK